MTYRFALLAAALFLSSVPARAVEGGATPDAGLTVDGVFFPYAVEGAALEVKAEKEHECRCWRTAGAVVGGAAAFVGYVPFALSDSRIGISDRQRIAEWSAVTAGAAVLGYWIGKKFDRR